ncbi:MAG: HINT domain-containing protein, partial [Lachnospiraceae bacterium]|nr:HINT domain-containing protein [Lachnospiraceae bacterium]
MIKTKDGEKNIEDVDVGDYVLARNPETGEQEYKKVSETFAHKEDVIVHVQIGNEDIQTTFNHP